MVNGWGPVEKDRSNGESAAGDGRAITLNGQVFAKGLGAHAASDVRYSLGGSCSRFKASLGVDDEVGTQGSVVFQVYADATKVYDSGVMTGASATQSVDVSVAGASQLRLVVTDGGDGNGWDHADWADARIDCTNDTTPPTVTSTSPADGATGVAAGVKPTATFSEPMDNTTLTTSTFTLVKQGTSTPIGATVSYDAASRTATLTPSANLDPNTTYTTAVKGGSGGAKDLAGNAVASDATWSFQTAAPNNPPAPVIDSPPSTLTWKVGDSISFSGHATHPEQGTLGASALSWTLIIHHCPTSPTSCHTHLVQTFNGVASGSVNAPDHDYPSWLRPAADGDGFRGSQRDHQRAARPTDGRSELRLSPVGALAHGWQHDVRHAVHADGHRELTATRSAPPPRRRSAARRTRSRRGPTPGPGPTTSRPPPAARPTRPTAPPPRHRRRI